MSKKLTMKQVRRYVEIDAGLSCPYCDSACIESRQIEDQTDRMHQDMLCRTCGNIWVDGYTLDSVGSGGPEDFDFAYPSHAEASSTRTDILEPPPKEEGEKPLFRAVFLTDVNAQDRLEAARNAHAQPRRRSTVRTSRPA